MTELTVPTTGRKPPTISVIVANYRCAQHLPAALGSILHQTVSDLEVIVSDDASPDNSVEVVREFARNDPRVRLIAAEQNGGPGAARNRALREATGEWIAIVDSDDIIHPERFEILLGLAQSLGADIIADDLMFFSEAGGSGATLLGEAAGEPKLISAAHFIRSNTAGSGLPSLGYVKPLIRRTAIGTQRYDETARIGEDYDFLLRCLLKGSSFYLVPEILYFYRRHANSISHRLSHRDVAAMVEGQEALIRQHPGLTGKVAAALERRMTTLRDVLAFEGLVAALKARKFADAIRMLAAKPKLAAPLIRSATEHFRKSAAPESAPRASPISLILREPDHATSLALNLALDLSGDVRTMDVPPAGRRTTAEAREAWSDLTRLSEGGVARVLGYGLAGLHAAPYALPGAVAAVIDDVEEASHARSICRAIGAPLIVSDLVKQSLVFPNIEFKEICPGYHRVIELHPSTRPASLSA